MIKASSLPVFIQNVLEGLDEWPFVTVPGDLRALTIVAFVFITGANNMRDNGHAGQSLLPSKVYKGTRLSGTAHLLKQMI